MEDLYQERVIAIRRRVSGEYPAVIYTSMNRSPSWFFKWWARYEKYGLEGLKDLPSLPLITAQFPTPDLLNPVEDKVAREIGKEDENIRRKS